MEYAMYIPSSAPIVPAGTEFDDTNRVTFNPKQTGDNPDRLSKFNSNNSNFITRIYNYISTLD
jgi:hypothetical protein